MSFDAAYLLEWLKEKDRKLDEKDQEIKNLNAEVKALMELRVENAKLDERMKFLQYDYIKISQAQNVRGLMERYEDMHLKPNDKPCNGKIRRYAWKDLYSGPLNKLAIIEFGADYGDEFGRLADTVFNRSSTTIHFVDVSRTIEIDDRNYTEDEKKFIRILCESLGVNYEFVKLSGNPT